MCLVKQRPQELHASRLLSFWQLADVLASLSLLAMTIAPASMVSYSSMLPLHFAVVATVVGGTQKLESVKEKTDRCFISL